MGYRSEVACEVRGPRTEMIGVMTALRLQNREVAEVIDAEENTIDHSAYAARGEGIYFGPLDPKDSEGEWVFYFNYHDVKWYEGYKFVDAQMNAWNSFKEQAACEGAKTNGIFIRIGEDSADLFEDATVNFCWSWGPQLNQEITFR